MCSVGDVRRVLSFHVCGNVSKDLPLSLVYILMSAQFRHSRVLYLGWRHRSCEIRSGCLVKFAVIAIHLSFTIINADCLTTYNCVPSSLSRW